MPIDFGDDLYGHVFVDDIVVPEPEDPEEEESGFWTRVWGGIKVVGGIGLAAAACSLTVGVGCVVAAAIGAGQAGAGLVQMWSGKETRNPIEVGANKVLQAGGVSEDTADMITRSAEAGYSLAVGVVSLRALAPPRITQAEVQEALHPLVEADKIIQAGGGDFVPLHEIFTVRIKGASLNSSYPGYDLRLPKIVNLKAQAQRWGDPAEGHVGHITSNSILRPGEIGLVRS